MNKGILYIVATPIGNLEDITLRALRVLKEVDVVACEDTRVTKKLLNHYNIETACVSCHQHSDNEKLQSLISKLLAGKNIALVTDAGTPGISDPGNILVQKALENEIQVVPIPGASALGALVSVAGIDMQNFVFLGFPPHKKGRETFFKKVAAFDIPVMYYDSPHRVIKNINLLEKFAPEKKMIVGRELTKMFEQIVRGTITDVEEYFSEHPDKIKGEFVIIVHGAEKRGMEQNDGE
jgi:16S rRNA (cytidine1402-2'-O)-methyltransferase